jgi:3-deoxy-7-phosphoheptulonate synthase/chorismate mutase
MTDDDHGPEEGLEELRRRIDRVNDELLELLSRRAELVGRVRDQKQRLGLPLFDPQREQRMLADLEAANRGPLGAASVRAVFQEILRVSLDLMQQQGRGKLSIARASGEADRVVDVRGLRLGERAFYIAGPCAVESEAQLDAIAARLAGLGVALLRGGAFKPRTSPHSFQGLGWEGLEILARVAARHGLRTISEVTDPRQVERAAGLVDVLQVGARNMYNYELLREIGQSRKPVLLKRAFAATADELLQAAEYVALAGSRDILLCERGIRTFVPDTRYTLDLAIVPLLRRRCALPVVVDPSHAAGRRDLLVELTRAAFAVGAQGVMLEVHPDPPAARCDAEQQLSGDDFEALVRAVAAGPQPPRAPA